MKKITLYAGTNYYFNNLYNFIKNLYVIIIGKFIKKFNQQEILYNGSKSKNLNNKKINSNKVIKRYMFTKYNSKLSSKFNISDSSRYYTKKDGDDPWKKKYYEIEKGHYNENGSFILKLSGSVNKINTDLTNISKNKKMIEHIIIHPAYKEQKLICILTGNRTASSINTIDNNGNIIPTSIHVLSNYLNGIEFLDYSILSYIFNINSFFASYKRRLDLIKLEHKRLTKQFKHAQNTKQDVNNNDLERLNLLQQQEEFLTSNFIDIKLFYDSVILNELIPNLDLSEFKLNLGLTNFSDEDLYNIILWSLNSRFIIRDNTNNDDIYNKIVTAEENQEFYTQEEIFNFQEKNSTLFLDSGTNVITLQLFYFLFVNNIKNNEIRDNIFNVGLYENIDFYNDYLDNHNDKSFMDYIGSILDK